MDTKVKLLIVFMAKKALTPSEYDSLIRIIKCYLGSRLIAKVDAGNTIIPICGTLSEKDMIHIDELVSKISSKNNSDKNIMPLFLEVDEDDDSKVAYFKHCRKE